MVHNLLKTSHSFDNTDGSSIYLDYDAYTQVTNNSKSLVANASSSVPRQGV